MGLIWKIDKMKQNAIKQLEINLSTGDCNVETHQSKSLEEILGGYGRAIHKLKAHLEANPDLTNAYDPRNLLCFDLGFLTGSKVMTAKRTYLSSLSPLKTSKAGTNGIYYSTASGSLGTDIRNCDLDALNIIGKAENYPMALESAIKIQEVSYIHAEGFAAGELKHGPIALITEGTPCIALVANDEVKEDVLLNTSELKARGAYIIGISPEKHDIFDEWIKVPDVGIASPLVNIMPIQLLAYYIAVLRGLDPDMPRNLAKSVTVK